MGPLALMLSNRHVCPKCTCCMAATTVAGFVMSPHYINHAWSSNAEAHQQWMASSEWSMMS